MARSPFFFVATLSAGAVLSGCGGSDNLDVDRKKCGSAFNPATNVRLSLKSFALDKPVELEQTRFRDLLEGVQPNNNSDNPQMIATGRQVAGDVERLTKPFIDAVYSDSGDDPETDAPYVSVRNPIDLMNDVIGKGTVDNFNEGRQYISGCIDAGNASQYSTGANKVSVQFEENSDEENKPNDRYRYPTLSWVYTPDTTGDVIRTIQYTASDDSFVRAVSGGSRFNGAAFSTMGFNSPKSTESSFTARETPNADASERLSLSQQLIDLNTDSWLRSGDTKFEFDGATVDCAKVVVNFAEARVDVYTSNGIEARAEGYCGTKEDADNTYSAKSVPRRQ